MAIAPMMPQPLPPQVRLKPGLFSVDMGDGSFFVATDRVPMSEPPAMGQASDKDALVGWAFERFREAVQAKKPETYRLQTNELYYAGFHYNTAELNRQNKVTNLCFATVETVWPVMTEQKPRPEIQARRALTTTDVDQLNDFAQWLMDTNQFDLWFQVSRREMLKQGWNCTIIVVDPATGVAYPKFWSQYDFYKDPFSRNEDEMEWCFLAGPIATERLRAMFPLVPAEELLSDNLASPGYEVLEKPYFENVSWNGTYNRLEDVIASSAYKDGQAAPNTSAPLVSAEAGNMYGNAGTTFLIQMLVRDRTRIPVLYVGDLATPNANGTFDYTPYAHPYRTSEPSCPSGWRLLQFTASGAFLDSSPVDPCFLGLPLEFGRDYYQGGRFYGIGELDHIIPINRSINKRYNLLNRSLEYEALPILIADSNTGIDIDSKPIEPGDTLKKLVGSQIEWLQFKGVANQQFEVLDLEKRDLDTVSGVHDVQQGRRPEGIEAAAAIRDLQDAAQTRIRGKEGPQFTELVRVLKKCMYATGKKAKGPILYRASSGEMKEIDPAILTGDYDIRVAQGSGTTVSRAMQEEKVLNLFELGLMDPTSTLERLGIKNVPEIMGRLQQHQIQQTQLAAATGQANGAPPGKKPAAA